MILPKREAQVAYIFNGDLAYRSAVCRTIRQLAEEKPSVVAAALSSLPREVHAQLVWVKNLLSD